jgi:ribosomal protein L12E/L44/L45/RPP1/RPP2
MEYIYSALVLYKVGHEITTEAMESILVAADIEPDKNKIGRMCAGLKDADIDKLLKKISVPVALIPPIEEVEVKEVEEKVEKEIDEEVEEEALEGLSALFG